MESSMSCRPSMCVPRCTFPASTSWSITNFQLVLTASNMLVSAGNCRRMSSDPMKMFSRYIHDRCTCSSASIVSEMWLRVRSQCSICCMNGTAYRDAFMVDSVTWLSSSAWKRSSVLRTLYISALYLIRSMFMAVQVSEMESRDFSIMSSLDENEEMLLITDEYWSSPSVNTFSSVKSSLLGSNTLPISSMSCCQWRSLSASFLRSAISGMVRLNCSTRSLSASQVRQCLISLLSFCSCLLYLAAASSIAVVSSSENLPVFQRSQSLFQSRVMPQIESRSSRSFSVFSSGLYTGRSSPKRSTPARLRASLSRSFSTSCLNLLTNPIASSGSRSGSNGPLDENSARPSVTCLLNSWRELMRLPFMRSL
mmetsp:Transcript_21536/g.50675  ORF Transcript_21536/g.50675 Transcript_21536/m.50675 type:complete len:367 (+) Transcript_21536:8781-9881(+)